MYTYISWILLPACPSSHDIPSQAKLEKLNSIVWPEIWRLAEEKIAQAHSDGHRVCVIDAAVMLNAGWQKHMHEVWVTIAPDTEVSGH